MTRINVINPWMGADEILAITEVIESGWIAQGPRVAEFETEFAVVMKAEYAVATSNCTSALHLALMVAGIGPGDDVVVPSLSFIATSNAPTYVGARSVFADVDPHTGNVTAATISEALTEATKAVIVVDQGGLPVDLGPIRALCDPLGIVVIEDAACGAGSTYRGRPVGAGAELTTWSFHQGTLLTTGEGGMLTTSNEQWAARARQLREHSMSVSAGIGATNVLAPPEEYLEVGFNFTMTDLQAALGLIQLGRLSEIVRRRRQLAARYEELLAGVPGLRPVTDPSWGESNFQSYWVEVDPTAVADREAIMEALAVADISARRGVMAAHRQPAYWDVDTGDASLAMTEWLTDNTLILPLYHQLTEVDQDRVVAVLKTVAPVGEAIS